MPRYRTLVGEPWDPKMDNWTFLSTRPENDAELDNYNIIIMDEAESVSPLPLWSSLARPEVAAKTTSSSRLSASDMVPLPSSPMPEPPPPSDQQETDSPAQDQPFSTPSSDKDAPVQLPGYLNKIDSPGDENDTIGDQDISEAHQDTDEAETKAAERGPTESAATSVHGLLLPNELLQQQLASAVSKGSDIQAAIDATKIAHHAISEKKHLETKLREALKKQNQLQRALKREQAECRSAIVAAQELKYTNTTLNVMISDLQAHLLNQQDAEERAARATGQNVTRKSTVKRSNAFVDWIGEIWLSVGHAYPQLGIAEKHWVNQNPQTALCAIQPLLTARQEGIAVESGHAAPLSELGILANLLRSAIQLTAKQSDAALRGIERMVHEARTSGFIDVERRAQWLRGHTLMSLDRPREARACFGFCAGPELPDVQLRAVRQRADEAIANLPEGHPGRQMSENFVQFYYQWSA